MTDPIKKYEFLPPINLDFGLTPRKRADSSLLSGLPQATGDILNTIRDTKRDYNQTKQNMIGIGQELKPIGQAIRGRFQKKQLQRYTAKFYVYVDKGGVAQRFTFDNFDIAQRFAVAAANNDDVRSVKGPVQQVL